MPTSPNDPAFPPKWETLGKEDSISGLGLTKREFFAAMVMQGMLNHPNWKGQMDLSAIDAVLGADALIAELNK